MTWLSSPFTPEAPFDPAHLPRYAELAELYLPKGGNGMKLEAEEDNVYPMNNWVCHRYTFSCGFYGMAMKDTVTFLNLNDKEQIVIHVSSREPDFKAMAGRSWQIIRSWHEIPSTALPPPVN